MQRLHRISLILFIIAVAAFAALQYWDRFVVDQSGPVITMESKTIKVSADATDKELLNGITAYDKKDGDVTDGIVIEGLSNFIDGNTRKMTVVAVDSDGHVQKKTRKVVYTSYSAPEFSLTKALRFPVGTKNILDNMKASDEIDGDLSDQIKISSKHSMQVDEPDDYPMEFTVTNSAGDVSVLDATVTIYDPNEEDLLPQIKLSQYIVYTDGQKINALDYVKSVFIDNVKYKRSGDTLTAASNNTAQSIPLSKISVTGSVDYDKSGTYEITYSYGSTSNDSGATRLIVVVRK